MPLGHATYPQPLKAVGYGRLPQGATDVVRVRKVPARGTDALGVRKVTCLGDRVPARGYRCPWGTEGTRKGPPIHLHSAPASTVSYEGCCRDRSGWRWIMVSCGCLHHMR